MKTIISIFENNKLFYTTLAILAILLGLPSINTGIQFDDIYHRLVMSGLQSDGLKVNDASFYGLYSFLDGNPDRTKTLMNQGVLPWWAFEEVKYTFFRPLTELSIWLDYQIWPDNFALMHFHNLFWFAFAAASCGFFFHSVSENIYLKVIPAFCFLLNGSNGVTVAWLAARNALIALAFGLLASALFILFTRNKNNFTLLASCSCLLLSMAAGEIGITSCAFIALYGLILVDEPIQKRIFLVTPFVGLTLLWLVTRWLLDFGAYGSGLYADPLQDSGLFVENFANNLVFATAALWSGIPVELLVHPPLSEMNNFFLLVGVFNLTLLTLFFPFWKNNKRAWFYLLLLIACFIPVAGSNVQGRTLIFASIPAFGFMMECIVAFFDYRKQVGKQDLLKNFIDKALLSLSILAMISHLLIAPLILTASQQLLAQSYDPILNRPAKLLELPENAGDKKLILVNPPNATLMGYLPLIRVLDGKSNAGNTWLLSSGYSGVRVHRPIAQTLEVEPNKGFIADTSEKIFRSEKFPLEKGQMIKLDGLEIKVLSLNEHDLPQKVEFRFEQSLESDTYIFKIWENQKSNAQFIDFSIPAIGESVELEPALAY